MSLQHDSGEPTGRTPSTGIASDNMYRMSGNFVAQLSQYDLSVDAYRIVHALMHTACRMLPEWSPDIQFRPENVRSRSLELRRTVGLEDVDGNRNLKTGVTELQATGLFDTLEFDHGTEWIEWRFADEILADALDDHAYGLLDASALPSLTDRLDYEMFARTSVVRRLRQPRTWLPVPFISKLCEVKKTQWSAVSRQVERAIQKVCRHYSLSACVGLECHGVLRGIDMIQIRFKRPDQSWGLDFLSEVDPEARKCLIIDGSSCEKVIPQDLPARLNTRRSKGIGSDRSSTDENSEISTLCV